MARKPGSIPKHQQAPAIPKHVPKPREFRPPGGQESLRIRFSHVDIGGPWCLTQIEQEHFADFLGRLKSFETMTSTEVFAPDREEGKRYSVAELPNPDARQRLVELELDDQTEIARLRISGERRVYGFLSTDSQDFFVLWWDPEHEIWPSALKHT